MNVLSLFDGISCGQIALERAEITVDKYYASEIEQKAIKVTQYNYPNTIQLGDVLKLDTTKLPKIDLLIGGSPCQSFSFAGRKEGMTTTDNVEIITLEQYLKYKSEGFKFKGQSYLFWEFVRILKEAKPKYFLLENVRMETKWKKIIDEVLGTEAVNINSKLVSAQLRNRYYWTNIPNITQPKDKGLRLCDIVKGYTDRGKARCLLESDSRPLTTPIKMFHRYYSTGFTTLVFLTKQHFERCKQHYDENFKGMSAKAIDKKLKDNYIDLSVYDGIRYLNQHELERCQTIPKGYTSILNRNDAASVIGNSWTVDVIAQIFKGLK